MKYINIPAGALTNRREAILTVDQRSDYTAISMQTDSKLEIGDFIFYPVIKDKRGEPFPMEVFYIEEQRPARGKWPNGEAPPMWYKLFVTKVPDSVKL